MVSKGKGVCVCVCVCVCTCMETGLLGEGRGTPVGL